VTHLLKPAMPGKRRGFAGAIRAMPHWAFTLVVVAVASSTVAMANVPASWLGGAAGEALDGPAAVLQAAAVPAPAQAADRGKARAQRTRCATCGVIQAIRRIEPTGDLPAAYEFTVRLHDGSMRISSSATQDNWRSGDRIMFIGGIAPPSLQ
jgi:hypothetical protein